MSNFQSINDEEIEQDSLVADVNTINSNIVVINNKMNLTAGSNMKTALDLNTAKTSFPGFGTSEGTALQGNTTTISSAQATAINSNSQKTSFPGFGTSGGTSLEGNTSLLALGTSSSTALAGNTALLALGTSSSTALAGDTITISSAQSNAISANSSKVSMTLGTSSSTALAGNTPTITSGNVDTIALNFNKLNMTSSSAMKTAVDANTNRFPQFTNIRRYATTTGDIYNDGKVKLNWDGSNRQLRFFVLDIPTGDYTVGGVEKWAGTSSTRISNYISRNNSTYYHYFTGPQLSGAVLNSSFNLTGNYTKATYFLTAYLENDWPSYEITVLIGYSAGYHTISIKRFN